MPGLPALFGMDFPPAKQNGRPARDRPSPLSIQGLSYLTNTEMLTLTVWPPGPYAVSV